MIQKILRTHRFLSSQLFYPLLLSSGLALSIYLVRVIVSSNYVIYANLVWNLFLAWIPYLFSMLAAILHGNLPKQWWWLLITGLIWLVFFPNAPYLVTDFLHLEKRAFIPIWYDILLLATFSWTGIFLAITSLRTMQVIIRDYFGVVISWIFAFFAIMLGGLGIYLGRFERWNSWDLLIHPKSILADIARRLINPLEYIGFFGFTILFTALMAICYWMFVSLRHLDHE